MNHYQYQGDNLLCEDLEIKSIANEIETPFYCYSLRSLKDNINKYKENLKNKNSKICFALKANSNLEIIKIIAEEGLGADAVSYTHLTLPTKA